jgi:hypothetical protein
MDLNDKTERVKLLHKKGKDSLYIQKHLGLSLEEIETILSPSLDIELPETIEINGVMYGKIEKVVEKLTNVLTYEFQIGGIHGMNIKSKIIKELKKHYEELLES